MHTRSSQIYNCMKHLKITIVKLLLLHVPVGMLMPVRSQCGAFSLDISQMMDVTKTNTHREICHPLLLNILTLSKYFFLY